MEVIQHQKAINSMTCSKTHYCYLFLSNNSTEVEQPWPVSCDCSIIEVSSFSQWHNNYIIPHVIRVSLN